MEEDFIIYQVKPHDNLGSIASRIDMKEDDLKFFHNLHCGKMDKIWFSDLRGIQFLCVPTHFVTPEKKIEALQKFLPQKKYSPLLHAKKYNVTENFERQNESSLNFEYDIELDFQSDEGQIFVNTHQKEFRKDGNKPDDKISSLALECRESISPIPFVIYDHGRIASLFKPKEIAKKFKSKREEIEDFHIGEVSKKYLDLFEDNISNESYFFKQLYSTILFQILFPNTNWFHKTQFWKEKYTIIPNSFDLEFKFNIEFDDSHSNLLISKITGYLDEQCSLRELLRGIKIEDEDPEDNVFSEIKLIYETDKVSKRVHSIDAKIIIRYQGENYQTQHLHLTQS